MQGLVKGIMCETSNEKGIWDDSVVVHVGAREYEVPSCRLRFISSDKSQVNDSQAYLANVYLYGIKDSKYLLGFNDSLNS